MRPPTPRTARLTLVAILSVAAALRVAGIDHHLRAGAPEFDERNNFIDPVLRMWRVPTLDPTVYAGYAGFFNWLILLPVGLGQALGGEVGAYIAGRAVVAAFGTLSVWLVYRAARAIGGEVPALAAAALLAIARVEVRHTHYITPDVLVGSAVLALCWIAQRPPSRRRDLLAGAIVGLATATKYSGLLLAPALAALFWSERRLRAGLPAAVMAAVVTFALAAPYAVLQATEQGTGLAGGLSTYYGSGAATNRFAQGEGTSIGALPGLAVTSLGVPACLVAFASLAALRHPAVAVAWAVVVATFAATVPANLVNPRHLLPAEAAAAFLFAVGLGQLVQVRAAAALLAIPAVLWPMSGTLTLMSRFLRPAAVDLAAGWIDRRVPGPALVVTSLRGLQLPRDRFEVRLIGSLDELPAGAPAYYDLVVASTRAELDRLSALPRLADFPVEDGDPQRPITILGRPPVVGETALAPETLQVARGGASGPNVWDGDPASCWEAPGGATDIEAQWTEARRVTRIEVESGRQPEDWPQRLHLFGLEDRWLRLEVEPLRPTRPHRFRLDAPWGQSYLLAPPRTLRGIRIERPAGLEWRLCEVRAHVASDAPPAR
jgi:4-amino-4-deoxy-L-arabinose transferase-like glycosyltransferase